MAVIYIQCSEGGEEMSETEVYIVMFFGFLILMLTILVLSLVKGAEKAVEEMKELRMEKELQIIKNENRYSEKEKEEKFKKGQVVRRGGYNCKYIVIGYKFDNYLLAIREGEEDKFTNREILYDKWLYTDEVDL